MLTLEKVTAAARELPPEFSLHQLVDKLEQLETSEPALATYMPPPRPDNLTPEEAAEWDYYTSPEAQALYNRFPVSDAVRALRGSIKLKPEDEHKSYDELRWEAMKEKYGL